MLLWIWVQTVEVLQLALSKVEVGVGESRGSTLTIVEVLDAISAACRDFSFAFRKVESIRIRWDSLDARGGRIVVAVFQVVFSEALAGETLIDLLMFAPS